MVDANQSSELQIRRIPSDSDLM